MIPKIIHYCWVGNNPLPDAAKKCIESWKKHMPDYEIKRWDETNYDFKKCEYMKEAYEAKKYGFVPDFARFDILYTYGGIYLDTDVELIKPLNPLIERGAFMGLEAGNIKGYIRQQRKTKRVGFIHSRLNPGSIIVGPKGFSTFKDICDVYHKIHFKKNNGKIDTTNSTQIFAKYIYFKNVMQIDDYAKCDDLIVYPKDYFCPLNYVTRRLKITKNTYSIHWYDASWLPKWVRNINHFFSKPSIKKFEKSKNKQS